MFLKKQPSSLDRYEDPTGEFSNKALEAATWYARHKVLFQKIGYWALVGWCGISVGGSLLYWTYYVLYGMGEDRTLLRSLSEPVNYATFRAANAAKQLQITGVSVFLSATNRYTLAADVSNPNPNWIATVTYRFSYGNTMTPSQTAVLLPRASRPLLAVTPAEVVGPQNPRFEIEHIDWQRLDPHVIKNPDNYIAARLQFGVEDVTFNTPAGVLDITQVKFILSNNTAYSYWEPTFIVELFQGSYRAGIVTVTVPEFQSGERRMIDVRSLVSLSGLTDIRVVPVIDIFKKDVYIEPGA